MYAIALLAACLAGQFDPTMPATVPAVNGTVVDSLTMRHIEVTPGTGAPAAPNKKYKVHYTGWLRDGTKFDSSVDRNEPFEFVQGRRQVITGWEIGFAGMKAGGKRRLFIPYQLAYGETGSGPIPPRSELIFDVELLEVTDAPQTPAAADVLFPFSELERKVMALAKAVPEEKYGWRPAQGVRTFGEVFLHIALGNQFLLNIANTAPPPEALTQQVAGMQKREKEGADKARILELLGESFAAVRKSLESARASALGRDAEFFGRPTTRRGIYIILDTHIAEHLGQAIAYARMNGIAPPWSGERAE